MSDQIRWAQVNGEPFEYAIQKGPHGAEFVKLLDGACLRRPLPQRAGREEIAQAICEAFDGECCQCVTAPGTRSVPKCRGPFAAADAILSLPAVQERRVPEGWNDMLAAMKRAKGRLSSTLDAGVIADLEHAIAKAEALSPPAPAPEGEWREIGEWTPKDGRHVIGWRIDGFGVAEYCHYEKDGWHVASFNGQIIRRDPQMWRPHPAPPIVAEAQG